MADGDDISQIHVVGAHDALGAWREEDGIPLEKEEGSNLWVGTAVLPLGEEIIYKYDAFIHACVHNMLDIHIRMSLQIDNLPRTV